MLELIDADGMLLEWSQVLQVSQLPIVKQRPSQSSILSCRDDGYGVHMASVPLLPVRCSEIPIAEEANRDNLPGALNCGYPIPRGTKKSIPSAHVLPKRAVHDRKLGALLGPLL